MEFLGAIADRFAAYIDELTKVIAHADRAEPLRDYCAGLLVTEGRRSVEPMAAVTAPAEVSAQHQRLLHFVANAPWSDEQMLAKVGELVTPSLTRAGPIEAWIIDDTSFPKKGGRIGVGGSTQSYALQRPSEASAFGGLSGTPPTEAASFGHQLTFSSSFRRSSASSSASFNSAM